MFSTPDRRTLLKSVGLAGAGALMPGFARAQAQTLVAATFPGTWNEAHRQVLLPAFVKRTGAKATQSIILGTDQISRLSAAKGKDSKPEDTGPGHENGASSEAEAAGPHLLGYGGMIHPAYGQEFELKRSGVLFDLDFDILQRQAALASRASYYRPPGNQPDSLFEFTVVLNESDSTARPVQIIRFLEIPEIQDISLKTIYRGAPLQSEEMAVSYKVRASRRNETLSGKDSQAILDRIIEALKAEGIPLRA